MDDLAPTDEPLAVTDALVTMLAEALAAQDVDTIGALLQDLTPAETAELIGQITDDDRHELIAMFGEALDPLVFAELDYELRRLCLSAMSAARVAQIISALESDDALDMLIALDPDFQKDIIRHLSAKVRLTVEEGLSFPEDSAGRLMQREVLAIPEFWTVGKTLDYLREAGEDLPEDFFDIFIVDPLYHITGHVPLSRLVKARRPEKLAVLALAHSQPIPATMDQEEVAHIFRRDNMTSAPVVDPDGRLIGVITIDDIVDVIDEESSEDIMKMAGVDQGDLYRAVITAAGMRSRWLLLNLLTATLSAVVVSFFGATIEQIVALAALMPVVASLGGNAGTQALTVAIRALATRQISVVNIWRIIGREMLVGFMNGILVALIAGTLASLWFGHATLGFVIGSAIIFNFLVAGFFGAAIPIFLHRRGFDPAVSAGVFLTALTDSIGFLIFLSLASVILL
ncbi:MAG: magnesium transporter [Alphaproteobacteria bacterium]|nr:magnesium transporter [Alphaproteobacteria bacterium]